jgi:3-oxoacyl-[acyl-carrier-protein] synthase-3
VADGVGVGIVGIGVCLPEHRRDNDWWPQGWAARQQERASGDLIGVVERAALAGEEEDVLQRAISRWAGDPFRGARSRRVIADDQESSDLEVSACAAALECAGLQSSDIDLLVGYSQVSDDAGPANHGIVAHRLGLEDHTASFTLEAGCASFLPQLTVATRLVQVGDHRRALLYQSSAISRVTDYDTQVSPNVGDGAVAQVVAEVSPGLGLVARVQTTYGELRDGLVLTRRDGAARWYEPGGDGLIVAPRSMASVYRMGAHAPAFARETCGRVLDAAGVGVDDVDFFICAQAAAWYTEACATALGLPSRKWTPPSAHFQRYGHLLAGSAPLNLWVAWSRGHLDVGDLVLLYSPGVGFTTTATLLRWSLPPPAQRSSATA